MSEELHGGGPCGLCGRDPAAGFASIGEVWFCHGDDDETPTCYERSQSRYVPGGASSGTHGETLEEIEAEWKEALDAAAGSLGVPEAGE